MSHRATLPKIPECKDRFPIKLQSAFIVAQIAAQMRQTRVASNEVGGPWLTLTSRLAEASGILCFAIHAWPRVRAT